MAASLIETVLWPFIICNTPHEKISEILPLHSGIIVALRNK